MILTTINVPFKKEYQLADKQAADFIKKQVFPEKYRENFFILFTEVDNQTLFRFCKRFGISIKELRDYYEKFIKRSYRNKRLEEFFRAWVD